MQFVYQSNTIILLSNETSRCVYLGVAPVWRVSFFLPGKKKIFPAGEASIARGEAHLPVEKINVNVISYKIHNFIIS